MRLLPRSHLMRALAGAALLAAWCHAGAPASAQEPREAATPAERRKVIIDDDGFGLMHLMLLNAPQVEVIGITTISGNVWANRLTAQTLRGLELFGKTQVPVYRGATYPLLNSEVLTERWEALYGKLTWKGAWMKEWVEPTLQATPPYFGPNDPVELPGGNPTITAQREIAAIALIRLVRAHPGEITIFAAGPMTNLALAQRLDPEFASLARELVYMGGSFNPQQALDNEPAAEFAREFANTPRREFNIRFDPEAASIVSRSPWRRITILPIDPTTATQLTPALLARLAQVASPAVAEFISGIEAASFPLWDESAAGIWLEPAIITASETLLVDYNTQFGPGYGDTLSWFAPYAPGLGEQPATVVRRVDPARLEALMVELVGNSRGE